MKLKYLFFAIAFVITFFSCNKDDDDDETFDAEAQALLDDETLIDYLQSNYYIPAEVNEPFGSIDSINNNETSLYSQVITKEIEHNDIKYNLYYLLIDGGVNNSPTRFDSVFVKYRGFTLDSIKFDESISFNSTKSWQDLNNVIQGWRHGFPYFKSGNNVTQPGEPIEFEGSGKGILFIPSGLAYGNTGTITIPPNESLLFHIELAIAVETDHDNDGVLTFEEDLDDSGEVTDDDTDEDGVPNYADPDDDGDGTLTKDESTTEDADSDGIVDYLDPDTK